MSSVLAIWHRLPQPLRYFLIGGINTAFGYGLFALCYWGLNTSWPYVGILVVSHVLAVSFSFTTQSRWVFSDTTGGAKQAWGKTWVRFQVSYLGLLVLGLAVNGMMLNWVTDSVWWAQAAATAVGVLVGYLVHRFFVFHRSGDAFTLSK